MKNFSMIGVGGFVAPRHLQAIKDTGNVLTSALDIHDSVGIIDSFFPNAKFFTEFERYDRHVTKEVLEKNIPLDYVSVCSPNYLHDAHIRFALRNGADAICEKPIVLNPWNVEGLQRVEEFTGKKVYTILQLRLHPSIIALKEKVDQAPKDQVFDFDLTYITSRGSWYHASWKGDENKSGGIATNIGVHFFDMLHHIFGNYKKSTIHQRSVQRASGFLEFDRARVRWFLSIDEKDVPEEVQQQGQKTYRSIVINGEEFEFSTGFTDLHTQSYEKILAGEGYGLEDAKAAIQIVHDIRNQVVTPLNGGDYHPFVKQSFISQ